MGLISAGDEHNRRSDDALSGIRNMQKVVEDVFLYDKDLSSHVERVRKVLQCCADHGITLHRKKLSLRFQKPATVASGCLHQVMLQTTTSSEQSRISLSQQIRQTYAHFADWLSNLKLLILSCQPCFHLCVLCCRPSPSFSGKLCIRKHLSRHVRYCQAPES